MSKIKSAAIFTAICWTIIFGVLTSSAQTTEFSYQGFLSDNSASANGNFDFEFRLFDVPAGGAAIGTIQRPNVSVTNGVFSVVLDFGAFPAANRFLEVAVRTNGSSVSTTLAPRSKILSTPYSTNAVNAQNAQNSQTAVNAQNAQNSQNALQLGGTAANQFVLTGDARLNDARSPLPNSANYIQNSTNPQTTSNFNVSGNGTAGGTLSGNVVAAATQFNIGAARVLSNAGSFNFFAGNLAGSSNTTGSSNAFFGANAGVFNSTGSGNAFFGFGAGRNNNAGEDNAYFGRDAGRSNTTGGSNSFFGKGAGADNTTATGNSFFGALAGNSNATGANNAFFGFEAGRLSETAFNNSFFGYEAGESNVIGLNNSFVGFNAGKLNTGSRNSFFGSGAGQVSTGSFHNSFFGGTAGGANTDGSDNSFFGMESGDTNTTGEGNTLFGTYTDVSAGNLTNAAAIGFRAFVAQSNALVLGSVNGINGATANTNVGVGTTAPLDRLHVGGIIRVQTLGAAGSTNLCRNANEQISTCSSSLRYKTGIADFSSGLKLVNRLRPITFNWKAGGMRDLGLGAEEVAAVEPLLVTYNERGEIEGVKYDRVAVVLLNAVKEQQVQIEQQRKQLQQQGNLIESLRELVCPNNPQAEVCK